MTAPLSQTRLALRIGGRERTATVVAPEGLPKNPPLLILFRKFTAGTFDDVAERWGITAPPEPSSRPI